MPQLVTKSPDPPASGRGHKNGNEADMPLFLNNDEVEQLITIKDTMEALEILYREMGQGAAVTAPRSDVHSPTAAAQTAGGPMAHY